MHDPRDEDTLEVLLRSNAEAAELPQPHSSLVQVDLASRTETGHVRPNNEDSYIVFRTGRYWERVATSLREPLPDRFEENGYGLVVADGMGGSRAGEVASDLAIRTGAALILSATKWVLKVDVPETRDQEIREAMGRAREYLQRIHVVITERARAEPHLRGMGTTLTSAYSVGSDLLTFHVGDSRAYLCRGGALQQLTRDDTVAQELGATGKFAPADLARWRHVLTEALGAEKKELRVQVQHTELQDGDWLLLCTDGLTDMVRDADITAVLTGAAAARGACDRLVDLALERGGRDNVTVVLARYTIPPRKP